MIQVGSARLRGPGLLHIAANSAWLLLARVGVQGLGVMLTLVVARTLGTAGFGQYAYVAAVLFIANVLTTFGTDTLLIRAVARAGHARGPLVGSAVWVQAVFSGLTVIAVFAWTGLVPQRSAEVAQALRVYALALFPLALVSVLTAVLRGFARMDLYFACSLGGAAAQAGAAWLALLAGGGLVGLAAALVAAQVATAGLALWLCATRVPRFAPQLRLDGRLLTAVVRRAWPLALVSVLGVVYQRLGVLAMTAFSGDAQTGVFAAAARVIEALKFGHIAVLGALLPVFARRAGKDQPRGAFRGAAWALGILGVMEAVGATQLAAPLAGVLYGPSFAHSAQAIQILAWALVPYSYSAVVSTWLVARGQERLALAGLAAGLAAALALNLWLIPASGISGACVAALGGEIVQALTLWRLSLKQQGAAGRVPARESAAVTAEGNAEDGIPGPI